MKILHILSFSLLASLLSTAAPSPLTPLPREQPQWWRKQYEQQVEQIKNNPCGVLFLGDSITDYWKREGKPIWEKAFSPYHPCNFGISGDQTTNLIYRITDSGIPAQTDPKLCIVMIGTNNTGYFKGGEAPEKTAMGILGTVEHLLVRFPDTHVLLLGIFPRGTGPPGQAAPAQRPHQRHSGPVQAAPHHLRQHQQALSGLLRQTAPRHQQGQPALYGKRLRHLGRRRAALYQKILQIAFFPILDA